MDCTTCQNYKAIENKPTETKEPIMLYCIKDYHPGEWLTKGKTYTLDGKTLEYDDGYVDHNINLAKDHFNNEVLLKDCLIELQKRPAKVGEYVLITDTATMPKRNGEPDYKSGDILKITGIENDWFRYAPKDCHSQERVLFVREYKVLNGYTPEPEPEQYRTFKVVCTETSKSKWFKLTAGKIYKVVNGAMEIDDGYISYFNNTVGVLNACLNAKFIEIVGEQQ